MNVSITGEDPKIIERITGLGMERQEGANVSYIQLLIPFKATEIALLWFVFATWYENLDIYIHANSNLNWLKKLNNK